MKVILLQNVPKIGQKYEVKEVAPGLARAVLIARGQALVATPAALNKLKKQQSAQLAEQAVEHQLAEKAVQELDKATIILKARASAGGHLFAALHAEDVAAAIKREKNIELSAEAIILEKPLKNIGFQQAKVRLGGRMIALTILIDRA